MVPTDLLEAPKPSCLRNRKRRKNPQGEEGITVVPSVDEKEIVRFRRMWAGKENIQHNEGRKHAHTNDEWSRLNVEPQISYPVGDWPEPPSSPSILANPRDEFSPSDQLTGLLRISLIRWDSETEATLAEQARSTGMLEEGLSEDEGLAYMVAEAVEGTLVDIARQNAAKGLSTTLLNEGRRFSSAICTELIWRLDLDPYSPRQFLDQLYNELREFAAVVPRKRAWGQLNVDGEIDLKLEIDVAAASTFPGMSDSDEEGWIVSE